MQHILSKTFYEETSVLNAAQIVAYKKKNNSYNFKSLPKTVILSISKGYIGRQKRFFSRKIKGLQARAYLLNKDYLYCCNFGNGAPAISCLIEELYCLGVKHFIFIGIAGNLGKHSDTTKNACYIKEAFSTSGCTYLYSPNRSFNLNKSSWATQYISKLKLQAANCWSTDMPFRETPSLILNYINKGANYVDMETATVYALAQTYNFNALAILIGADTLNETSWQAPKNTIEVTNKIKQLIVNISSLDNEI